MKVSETVFRCDSCGCLSRGGDVFKQFSVVKIDQASGKVRTGIALKNSPMMPAILHSCPDCEGKIELSAKMVDPSILPAGPLRTFFEKARSKDFLRALKIY